MKKKVLLLLLLTLSNLSAQEEEVHSLYFEFDRFDLKEIQIQSLLDFIRKLDTTTIKTIEIFGYCDDRGKDAYNFTLSNHRAQTVKTKLLENGIKNKIIITIEGKGRILIDDDVLENIPEVRSKNRRVDVVINYKPVTVESLKIPGVYSSIPEQPVAGDRIYLEKLLFDRGSSKLSTDAKKELDRLAKQLHKFKNIEFEIQGHVCCIPYYQKEAIDRDSKKRELSINRAIVVYEYLFKKKIKKERMTHKGYGNSQPLKKGPQFDRRVEIVITKVN
ncbi:OmpA family protein [Flavobacterium sp. TP390]|uniref:OmpA family protein n=1 Tax=Flavobacterium profundi TaxID=1774945 RepID=A0A6I4IUI7_9FLAO|nr:OmpA family protein [Flavobacterium profundi]MVO10562.1 OmpA family protein [Flavobacterium profundi]